MKKMDIFTLRELYQIDSNRRSMGVDIGVLDQGIYYLVAIILKELVRSNVININKKRRDFLQDMLMATNGDTLYRYLLQNIVETSCSIKKWNKWANKFVFEYQRNMDLIVSSELKRADDIINYYPELLDCIQGVDEDEDYIDTTQISKTFSVEEMIPAVERFVSQSQEDMAAIHDPQFNPEELSKSYIRESGFSRRGTIICE